MGHMLHTQKNRNPIVRLALLLVLVSTPIMTSLLKSDYVLAQTSTQTPSFTLPTEVPQGTKIRIDGSASMTKANEALKERFEKEYSGTDVEVANNGTDNALKALQEGKIDIAAIGRGLTPEEEQQGLQQERLRREKIAIIVGKDNPYKGDLTNQQFTQIYRGEITDWSELGGGEGKIKVIDRPDFSDTREAFRSYPLFSGNFQTGSNATQLDSDDPAEVVKQLGNDGIGFVLANQVSKLDNVRILSMHKTLPDDPRYPYSQPLVYVFKQNPPAAVQNFVGFATAKAGQEALEAAREQEASAVAAAVAGNVAAIPTNEAADNVTATENVGTATNTSARDDGSTAFLPRETAGVGADAGKATISPLVWLGLAASAIGALALWLLLGRRKSQEDDTVARGVLPADSPPPFTPSTTGSSAVAEPVDTPLEPVPNTKATTGINAAPVEPAVSNINPGLGVAGLGVAAASSNQEDTSDVRENSAKEPISELDIEAPDDLQQPDNDRVEASNWEQTDIPDTSLDLEAPAAVVNSSYHSLPRITVPVDIDEEATPTTEEQESGDAASQENLDNASSQELPTATTNNWLGSFAAAAGAKKIKSKLAGKDAPESVQPTDEISDEQLKNGEIHASPTENRTRYAQLPDVWETPPPQPATNNEDNSFPLTGAAAAAIGAIGAAAIGSSLLNRDEEKENSVEESEVIEDSPSDLWETPPTEDNTATSSLLNRDRDLSENNEVEELNQTSFPDLWGTPSTEESTATNDLSENNDVEELDRTSPSDLWGTPPTEDNTATDDISEDNVEELNQTSPSDLWGTPPTEQATATDNVSENNEVEELDRTSPSDLWGTPPTEDNTATDDISENNEVEQATATDDISENNEVEQATATDDVSENNEVEEPTIEEESSFSLGGAAAAVTGAAIASDLLNRDKYDTPEDSNNADESSDVEEQANAEYHDDVTDASNFNRESSSNSFTQNTPTTDTTQASEVEQVTPSNPNPTPEETTKEAEIAQFGVSSTADNPTSAVGAFTLGSQTLNKNLATSEPSASQVSFGEDIALDKIADEAEANTNIPPSEPDLDPEDSAWDRIYGIHHHGATGVPGESNILLANRTPKWAYASWNIAPSDREAMQSQGATQLVLRLYDVTNIDLSYQEAKLVQQYECEETVSHRYVAIPNTDKDYIAEIGYHTKEKNWLLVSRSPIVRVFSRPHKDFWFEADAELIIHGATEPGSTVNIDGHNIKVKQDGTFHLRIPFTESLINYLITAVAPDTEQARTIHMQFSQKERKNS